MRKRLQTFVMVLCVVFSSGYWGANAAQLGKIEIVDPGRGNLKEVRANAYLDAPVEKVWQVLVHYENYHRFLPRVKTSELNRRKGNMAIATMRLDLPFPMNGTWYTNRYIENPQQKTIEWIMLKGSLKATTGRWKLRSQGKGTAVEYRLRTDPGIPLIPKALIDMGTKRTIPEVLKAVEAYARQLK